MSHGAEFIREGSKRREGDREARHELTLSDSVREQAEGEGEAEASQANPSTLTGAVPESLLDSP